MADLCFFVNEGEVEDLQQRITDAIGERFEIDSLPLSNSLAAVVGAMVMDIAEICDAVVRNELEHELMAKSEVAEAETFVESLRKLAVKINDAR